ncbi:MAG: pilus assembly PilX family protein [Candidatus Saccharimonadales bacterium]
MSKTDFQQKMRTAREAGLVSIMVTLILMIVISLIVLGFAQVSRRNQRQALDRQLSTQAFYAAESGVNDARDLINQATLAGNTIPAKDDCAAGSGIYAGLRPDLDTTTSDEAAYTCVMVNPTPQTLLYGDVGDEHSTIIPLSSESGINISRVNLTWQSKDDTSTPTVGCPTTTSGVFSPTSSWTCGYGVLRLDIVPTSGVVNYSTLQNNTMTTFLVPQSSGGSSSTGYAAGGANNRIGVACTNASCTFSITGLSVNQYYMRISSIYKNVSLQVTAFDSANNQLALKDAQAIIDSTGKAQDVLRRIQVHVPLTVSSENQLSDYVLQSTDSICKRFVVMDNYFDTQVSGVTSGSPLCQDVP